MFSDGNHKYSSRYLLAPRFLYTNQRFLVNFGLNRKYPTCKPITATCVNQFITCTFPPADNTMVRLNCVDHLLKKLFYKLGFAVAKNPGYFLIVPVFLTALCVTGFQRLHYEMDSEFLFSPEKGPSKTERSIIESYFKVNYSYRFNPTRITRPGKYLYPSSYNTFLPPTSYLLAPIHLPTNAVLHFHD